MRKQQKTVFMERCSPPTMFIEYTTVPLQPWLLNLIEVHRCSPPTMFIELTVVPLQPCLLKVTVVSNQS